MTYLHVYRYFTKSSIHHHSLHHVASFYNVNAWGVDGYFHADAIHRVPTCCIVNPSVPLYLCVENTQISNLNKAQNLFVGLVDDGAFQRREVDLGGGFIVMPHALADDGEGNVLALGGTRP